MKLRLLPPSSALRSTRWSLLAGIVLLGMLAVAAVQGLGWSVTRPTLDLKIILFAVNLGLYLWVRTASGLRLRNQILTLVVLVLAQFGVNGLVRVDGFVGDGRPQFRWRWTPTPEQRLANAPPTASAVNETANLAETTPFDFPEFRGRDRTGTVLWNPLLADWSKHPPHELWRRPVGRAWSSFAVVGDCAVTQEQKDDFECVVCYRLRTGELIWEHRDQTRFDEVTSGPGPRATPTITGGRVYTFGGTGILNCLNGADGKVIWSQTIPGAGSSALFGQSCSPLVHGELVYVTPGGVAGSLVAVSRATGEIVWTRGDRRPGYSSPQLLTLPDLTLKDAVQILVFDAQGLHGYAAVTGDELWSFPWGDGSQEQVNVAQPVIVTITATEGSGHAARLLISSGYGRGCALLELLRDASGDWTIRELWHSTALKSKFSDLVVHNGYVYGLDEGILTCLSLLDGARQWKQGRYGYGQLLRVNDWLLVQAESGRVALVELNPDKFTELAELDALAERTWNHPVIAGGCLLVRNDREAACFQLPAANP